MRKFIVTNLIIVIMAFSFIAGFTKTCNIVYAASIPEGWTQTTNNTQLVNAFRSYCKSRNIAVEGSALDAITTSTSKIFNDICYKLGIDSTSLQAEIAYKTSDNTGLQWYFTTNGISTYNRIFAELLQNYDLSVGSTVPDTVINEGSVYGGTFLYFTEKAPPASSNVVYLDSDMSVVGSVYLSADEIISRWINGTSSVEFGLPDGSTQTLAIGTSTSSSYGGTYNVYKSIYYRFRGSYSGYFDNASVVFIVCNANSNNPTLYWAFKGFTNNTPDTPYYRSFHYVQSLSSISDDITQQNVYITTNNQTINNNTYEGDTIINNYDTPSDPDNPDDPDYPDDPDTPITPTLPNIPGIELPDLSDLNSVNLFLDGLKDKFPFSIPWDMYLLLAVLNAPPEAPHFQGTVDFKIYEWNYDLDFSEFEQAAQILRALELLSFTMGLILITRNIIRG